MPALLAKWQPNDCVRLAWCRVHDGEFGQPRKSSGYVAISQPADLIFLGREGDSLYFEVSAAPTSPAIPRVTKARIRPRRGFRFDLPSDEAIALPQVLAPPTFPPPSPTPPQYPGGLLSYPLFVYHESAGYSSGLALPSMLVGNSLRNSCNFELALKWYERAFNPLKNDCA